MAPIIIPIDNQPAHTCPKCGCQFDDDEGISGWQFLGGLAAIVVIGVPFFLVLMIKVVLPVVDWLMQVIPGRSF